MLSVTEYIYSVTVFKDNLEVLLLELLRVLRVFLPAAVVTFYKPNMIY